MRIVRLGRFYDPQTPERLQKMGKKKIDPAVDALKWFMRTVLRLSFKMNLGHLRRLRRGVTAYQKLWRGYSARKRAEMRAIIDAWEADERRTKMVLSHDVFAGCVNRVPHDLKQWIVELLWSERRLHYAHAFYTWEESLYGPGEPRSTDAASENKRKGTQRSSCDLKEVEILASKKILFNSDLRKVDYRGLRLRTFAFVCRKPSVLDFTPAQLRERTYRHNKAACTERVLKNLKRGGYGVRLPSSSAESHTKIMKSLTRLAKLAERTEYDEHPTQPIHHRSPSTGSLLAGATPGCMSLDVHPATPIQTHLPRPIRAIESPHAKNAYLLLSETKRTQSPEGRVQQSPKTKASSTPITGTRHAPLPMTYQPGLFALPLPNSATQTKKTLSDDPSKTAWRDVWELDKERRCGLQYGNTQTCKLRRRLFDMMKAQRGCTHAPLLNLH
eukprot:TRINITY_DN2926_c0_g1_i1.p1 TRINITY_DN2926_c0_g1~~TRINITY_DN2926_c0_g1_i1.p1  ORF type:complete len:443 (+),score=47.52 TRINITY_DN2926_c0_g1_i1:244-1572(+)